MPIISHRGVNVYFSHIPKNGGSAVEAFFRKTPATLHLKSNDLHGESRLGFPCSPQHFHAEVVNSLFRENFFDLKFAVVRHPLDRLASEYRMRMGPRIRNNGKVVPFQQWAMGVFERFQKNSYILDNHIRPQVEFVDDLTQVFEYDDGLEQAVAAALAKLGLYVGEVTLPRKNVGTRVELNLSDELLHKVEEFYRRDFDVFGYKLEDSKMLRKALMHEVTVGG